MIISLVNDQAIISEKRTKIIQLKVPQIMANLSEKRFAFLILSKFFAPKFWPIKGIITEDNAINPIIATDSILEPTPKAATVASQRSAAMRVKIKVDIGKRS